MREKINTRMLSIRIDEDLLVNFNKHCKDHDLNASKIIRCLIQQHLKKAAKENKKGKSLCDQAPLQDASEVNDIPNNQK